MHNIIKLYLFFEVAWFISLNSGYVYRTKFGRCEKGCLPLWICDGGEGLCIRFIFDWLWKTVIVLMGYFGIWFAGGENDRNYFQCKYESNDAGNLLIFKVMFFFPIQYLQIARGLFNFLGAFYDFVFLCIDFNLISHNQLLGCVSFNDWSIVIHMISCWSWCGYVNLTFESSSSEKFGL